MVVLVMWAVLVAIAIMLSFALAGCIRHLTQLQAQQRITDIHVGLLYDKLGVTKPKVTELSRFERMQGQEQVS